MKALRCAVAAALVGAAGCGESDNAMKQTPNDQPIMQPGGLKGGGRGAGAANPPVTRGGGRSVPVGGQGLK